jgi:hypothetical protein
MQLLSNFRFTRLWVAAFFYGLLFSLPLCAQEIGQRAANHTANVRTLLVSARLGEINREDMHNHILKEWRANKDDVGGIKQVVDDMSVDEFVDFLTPIYAKHIQPDDMRAIMGFFTSAAGKAAQDLIFLQLQSGADINKINYSQLTTWQIREINTFAATEVGKRWFEGQRNAKADIRASVWGWLAALDKKRLKKHSQAFAAELASITSMTDLDLLLSRPIPKFETGYRYLDRMYFIEVDVARRFKVEDLTYERVITPLQINQIFTARYLSAEGTAGGLKRVAVADAALTRYLQHQNAIIDDYRAAYKNVVFPADYQDRIEKKLADTLKSSYARLLDLEETERAVLDLWRKALGFIETRQKDIAYEDDKILFATSEDLQLYRALQSQMVTALAKSEKQGADLIAERQKRLESFGK